jgi:transcription initiation factor TFIIH subunit 1
MALANTLSSLDCHFRTAATENQKRGRPGQLVDPRPQTVEGGEVKIVITPQLVHDIFEEFPVVAKAYSDNVPNKLSEAEFWKRYFQSKLFNTHRASIRSSATQHVVKEDPIFDKYLEKDDDELEPRRPRDQVSDLYISLGATLEDHEETGNEKDITMKAGRQRGALPLIRKFNEHSERLLNSALGDVPRSKRRRVDGGDGENSFSEIEYDDLQDHESSPGILLEMQDRQRYFEGQLSRVGAASGGGEDSREVADVQNAFKELLDGVNGWEGRFSQLKIERKSGDAALLSMTQNVAARLDTKTNKSDFPPGLFRQLTTCQTAANEFLRQFWTSIYPSPADLPTPTSTSAQRSAKAAKMAVYLGKTHEKVDALVRAAVMEGVEGNRVVVAMKPLMDAVEHALAFHRARSAAVGSGVTLEKPGGLKLI